MGLLDFVTVSRTVLDVVSELNAYRVFLQMNREGFWSECNCKCGGFGVGEGGSFRAGLESDVRVGSALVDMDAKRRSL